MHGRVRDDQPDVGITEAESSVLGVFLTRAGVDSAVLGLHDDIGRSAVVQRVAELELEFGPSQHFVNEQCRGIGI